MLGAHGSSERKKLFILSVSSFTQRKNSRKGRISLCLPQVILLILQGKNSLSLNTSLSIISSNDTVKCKVSVTYYLAASLNAVSFHHLTLCWKSFFYTSNWDSLNFTLANEKLIYAFTFCSRCKKCRDRWFFMD